MKNKFQLGLLSIFFVVLTHSYICQAQKNYNKFSQLTIDNGLSSNRIWSIFRDSKDYLWISTDVGLDKYDSYQVKKYRYDEKQPCTISSNIVISIYEDGNKKLWFGSINGLNLYDPETDNFKVYKNIPDDKNSLNGNKVNSITEDKNGDLWFLTDGNCLNKWVPNTQNFIRYPFENRRVDLYPRPAKMVACDSKGFLWVVSLQRGIHRFDPKSGEFIEFDDPTIDFGVECYKSIYIDKQDKIWITSDGSGFFSYDIARNKFEQFGSDGDHKGTNKKIILDIIPEDDRYLLLAVDQGGINRFDKVLKTFEYIVSDKANDHGLNNNGLWCIYRDSEGILWVGTSGGGINYFNPKKEKFKLFTSNSNNPNSLAFNFTGCFFEDHEGMIWIGTDGGGVNVYNPETGVFTLHKHDSSDPYSISGNVIRSIAEDKNHDMWIGTWDDGLNRYDRKTGKFHRFLPDRNNPLSISDRNVWNLTIDQYNMIWLSLYHVGIDLFDPNKGVVRRFRVDEQNSSAISSNESWLFFEDADKKMWICTTNGLNCYNRKTDSFRKYNFPDNVTGAFCKDMDGNLWVGTNENGLYFCNPNGEILNNYNITNGLPHNRIHAIVEDNQGNIWISSGGGITQFNRKTQKFRNYTKDDGLQSDQFFQQSFLKTRKGDIYFGGYNGFNCFKPESLKDNDFIVPVYLTDFQIFNKPVSFGSPQGQFPKHISEAKEITLNWSQSVFSFSFAAINYTSSEKNQYAYMMEGFEKEWNYTNSSRRYVTYTNLDPGRYTFKVKASNNDGVWNEKGVSLDIIILPPWWKAWWFKAFLVVIICIIIFLGYYLRLQFYRKKQKELSVLVDRRTNELTSANHKLVERQALIEKQSEELVKLNSTKDRVLSIIAHDLRNPFNVVSGFSELLLEDFHQLTPEVIETYLTQIYNSSKNGNVLLDNLLQWSRTQTGSITFEPVRLRLQLVAKETCNFLEGAALKKNISIQLEIDADLHVEADENMLKTVLRNLLSNAIKFTPENGCITVKATTISENVEVGVCDSGVGITAEKMPLLFNIETNTSTKGTSNELGTGLGLVLCKEFIDRHNQKIWVESKVGVGTQFKFTLPFA